MSNETISWAEPLRWEPDLASREVTLARVEDCAFAPMQPRLRNELITRTYGDLAQEFSTLLGTESVTWAAFGQWASFTIGGYLGCR